MAPQSKTREIILQRYIALLSVVILLANTAYAQDDIPAGQLTLVEYKTTLDSFNATERKNKNFKDIYHYKVYLPVDYYEVKSRRYPCLFVASPGGNANMTNLKDYLVQNRWIVICLVESKNRSSDWYYNFVTAFDVVKKRFRILMDYKFAVGLSGGARCISSYPRLRKGFAGLVMQAAGLMSNSKDIQFLIDIPIYLTLGDTDYNLYESDEFYKKFPADVPHKVEIFKGGHGWAPKEVTERALEWLTANACEEGQLKRGEYPKICAWRADNLLLRLKRSNTAYQKYLVIEKLRALSPYISDDKISQQIQELNDLHDTLIKKPEVVSARAAHNAYKSISASELAFRKVMTGNKTVYKKRILNDKQYLAMGELASAYQSVAVKWADTHWGKLANIYLNSLKMEYKAAALDSFSRSNKKAISSKKWDEVAKTSLLLKLWSENGSATYNNAVKSYELACIQGDKSFAKIAKSKNIKVLMRFEKKWAVCPCAGKATARAEELGEAAFQKATKGTAYSRPKTLRKLLTEYKSVASIYGKILDAYEEDAQKALAIITKPPMNSSAERKLGDFIEKWSPAPSTTKAKTILSDILMKKLDKIMEEKSISSKKYKLKSFIKKYRGTNAGNKAISYQKELKEQEAEAEWQKLLARYNEKMPTSTRLRFIKKYSGTKAAQKAREYGK